MSGRQDYLRSTRALCRDAQREAVATIDLASRWRRRRDWRNVPHRNLQCEDSTARASLLSEGRQAGAPIPAPRAGNEHQGTPSLRSSIARSVGLQESTATLRTLDSDSG